jgi:hypothetical protein
MILLNGSFIVNLLFYTIAAKKIDAKTKKSAKIEKAITFFYRRDRAKI